MVVFIRTQMCFLEDSGLEDGFEAAGVDGGMRTFLTVYDLGGGRLLRIGHGLAQHLDVRFQQPRRRLQARIGDLLQTGYVEESACVVKLRQQMRKLQVAHDAFITVCAAAVCV